MRDVELEECFPKLRNSNYNRTSDADPKYNCVAYSLGCTKLNFQLVSFPSKIYFWPPGIPRDDTVESWMQVYIRHGYSVCETGDLEPGTEKIAIYGSVLKLCCYPLI
jgi:hypothetical protein